MCTLIFIDRPGPQVADRLGLKVVPRNIATPFPEDLTGQHQQQRGATAGEPAAADPTANFDEKVQDTAAMFAFEDVMPANFERLYWYDQKKRPAPPLAPKRGTLRRNHQKQP